MFEMAQHHQSGPPPGPACSSSCSSSSTSSATTTPPPNSSSSSHHHLRDTTFTKVFVGGLAWETQRDTMRRHFEQFGEILEAVVITDKNTGRSKGYGFVTFRDPEAARRACADATPIIDGRRANCNLASLGAHHRLRPSFPTHGNRFPTMAPSPASLHPGGAVYVGGPSFPPQSHYAFQQGFPYQTYGYPSYSQEFAYQPSIYYPFGSPQYPQIYTSPTTITSSAMYPYMQYSQNLQAGYPSSQNYSVQLPQVMQYGAAASVATVTTLPQQYGGLVPLPTTVSSSGVTLTCPSATGVVSPGPSPPQIFAIQQQFPQGVISEQPSG